MRLVLFTHPQFLASASMPRFAKMIADGMEARGHDVQVWSPSPIFHAVPLNKLLRKWLGYIDQYVIFPFVVLWKLLYEPKRTVFIFVDQALGPWVPLVANRPHVVHVHDFLALRSALGEIPQNPTGWTGKKYQAMIRGGFSKGRNFISVSNNTKNDLARFLSGVPSRSEVVYNGLNFKFNRMSVDRANFFLLNAGIDFKSRDFLLHVGGNQWYKNRLGVLEIYVAYARLASDPLPLLMIGEPPTAAMIALVAQLGKTGEVRFVSGLDDHTVCAAYSVARLLVFPSLAEGFGWPIAEAMACGCAVLTTGEAPMTEVGGDVAHYMPLRPLDAADAWARDGAHRILKIISLSPTEESARRVAGLEYVKKFDSQIALNSYEMIYQNLMPE